MTAMFFLGLIVGVIVGWFIAIIVTSITVTNHVLNRLKESGELQWAKKKLGGK